MADGLKVCSCHHIDGLEVYRQMGSKCITVIKFKAWRFIERTTDCHRIQGLEVYRESDRDELNGWQMGSKCVTVNQVQGLVVCPERDSDELNA